MKNELDVACLLQINADVMRRASVALNVQTDGPSKRWQENKTTPTTNFPSDNRVSLFSTQPPIYLSFIMVFYYTSRCGDYLIYMGKDKFENESLIRYGLPEDVWFHVDNLSSAHVYLRLKPGMKLDDM